MAQDPVVTARWSHRVWCWLCLRCRCLAGGTCGRGCCHAGRRCSAHRGRTLCSGGSGGGCTLCSGGGRLRRGCSCLAHANLPSVFCVLSCIWIGVRVEVCVSVIEIATKINRTDIIWAQPIN